MSILRGPRFVAALSALAFAWVALAPSAARASVKTGPSRVSPAKQARLQHARELLGPHYIRSGVSRSESLTDLAARVRRMVRHAMGSQPIDVSDSVARTILLEARRHGLDPVFITAVIQAESGFQPEIVGEAGEIGLMQILPDTAAWVAEKYGIEWLGEETLYDPVVNVRIGAAYFAHLRENFDSRGRLYVSAYNMGPANVKRAIDKRVYPKDYVKVVLKRYVALHAGLNAQANRAPASGSRSKARKPAKASRKARKARGQAAQPSVAQSSQSLLMSR